MDGFGTSGLDAEIFFSIEDARKKLERWRIDAMPTAHTAPVFSRGWRPRGRGWAIPAPQLRFSPSNFPGVPGAFSAPGSGRAPVSGISRTQMAGKSRKIGDRRHKGLTQRVGYADW
jgi:hypothetical protein